MAWHGMVCCVATAPTFYSRSGSQTGGRLNCSSWLALADVLHRAQVVGPCPQPAAANRRGVMPACAVGVRRERALAAPTPQGADSGATSGGRVRFSPQPKHLTSLGRLVGVKRRAQGVPTEGLGSPADRLRASPAAAAASQQGVSRAGPAAPPPRATPSKADAAAGVGHSWVLFFFHY